MLDSPSAEPGFPAKLKRDKNLQPCPAESGDEHYQNGIFEFNITRLLAFIDTCADRFPIELVSVAEFPNYGGSHLDEETVRTADLSRPILLAEIAPGLFNVIDGNHRLARARCEGVQAVPSAGSVAPITFPSSLPPGRMRSTLSTGIPNSGICRMRKLRASVERALVRVCQCPRTAEKLSDFPGPKQEPFLEPRCAWIWNRQQVTAKKL